MHGGHTQSVHRVTRTAQLQVTVLPSLPRLLRLDLGGNRLASLNALAAHSALKWLSVAHNGISALPPLHIPELQVSSSGHARSCHLRTFSCQLDMQGGCTLVTVHCCYLAIIAS